MLGKMVSGARVEGMETTALALCTLSLIGIFLTGFVGYFVVNWIWPDFYYSANQRWEGRVAVHAARLHGRVRGRGFSRIQRHPPHKLRDGVMCLKSSHPDHREGEMNKLTSHQRETTMRSTFMHSLVAAALALAFSAGAQAQESMSPLVKQMFDGGWPDKASVEQLNMDRLYYAAIETYMLTLPALNTIGMRDGSEAKFGKGYNVLPIWKDRMNARTWVPTPNCDVIYSMSYLDLKETGPLVVHAPPHVIGMFTDFFQRTITDVGAIGPDRARGGLYLLLPPDYQGHVPAGYFVFKSSTYNVFLFFRTVMRPGTDGPDPAEAVALAETTRVYPLDLIERERKPMQFPNGSNVRVNTESGPQADRGRGERCGAHRSYRGERIDLVQH